MQTELQFAARKPGKRTPLDALTPLPAGRVALDLETDGTEVHGASLPVGIAIATGSYKNGRPDDRYLPFGHAEGRQHDPGKVRAWARDSLANRDVWVHKGTFDFAMARKWGLDLEALGCRLHAVQHCEALLDEHERKFDLESLGQKRLGRGKLEVAINKKDLWRMPPDQVAPYARQDARLTLDLAEAYYPLVEAEGLGQVLDLEDSLIYCVAHMERQGALLDVRKMERWKVEIENERIGRIIEIYRRTGLRVNPNSGDVAKLFKHLNIPVRYVPREDGEDSATFDEETLQQHVAVPEIKMILEARQLDSLLSKYIVKYLKAVEPGGLLRYQLHQLRNDEQGTITGRFASSKVNIQQVMKFAKQAEVTKRWPIRELFVPPPGSLWLSADASQIEYRLFAHYSSVPPPHSTRLIKAYTENPNISFHKFVAHDILKDALIYDEAKNFNFGKLYGFGLSKAMWMLGTDDSEETQRKLDLYDQEFPEAKRLLNFCTKLCERRGYVKTFLGRRRRYRKGDRYYSALNSVLQGTAADVLKKKLLETYRGMASIGGGFNMRFTVHDEIDGECQDAGTARRYKEFLDVQSIAFRVPLLWDVKTGASWKV